MQRYLFVHFKEKTMPDGEQVYFGLSEDGFNWQPVNGGQPVLWAYYGDKGVRDHTIVRNHRDGVYHIFATDLSLSYGMRNQYHRSWDEISCHGSKCLAHWQSEDLVHWTEQELIRLGDDSFGCLWAPDVIFDAQRQAYVLHWSSSRAEDNFASKAIYCSRTTDFVHFTAPELLYRKKDASVIDSAIYQEDGVYYMFVKSGGNPERVILLSASDLAGPWQRVRAFDGEMSKLESGKYEAPTAMRLEDGRWCLFLDYYGVPGAGQGYVPFVAPSLKSGDFVRSDRAFSFPYGFKHGTILTIGEEEYERLRTFRWPQN